jgi:patatin-like phospholipase/acyl hydrolase
MKILCIDGGGIFGYLPAYVLSKVSPDDLPDFSAYGGTSVGSILTASYSMGKSPSEVCTSFALMAERIFKRSFLRRFNPLMDKFPASNVNEPLKEWFGKAQLRNLKKYNIVTTYDYAHGRPKVYDNITPENPDMYEDVWKVCRKSSAAPTYFPPCEGYVDGGIVANNPVMVTAWALRNKLGIPFSEMEILSIGTGTTDEATGCKNIPSTSAGWLNPMLDMLTTGNEQMFHFGASQCDFKKYVRFNPFVLETGWDMSDKSLLPALEEMADRYVNDFVESIKNFCN